MSVALQQWEERERGLDYLRAPIAEGLEAIEHGGVIEWTPELADEIWREGLEAAEAGEETKTDVLAK